MRTKRRPTTFAPGDQAWANPATRAQQRPCADKRDSWRQGQHIMRADDDVEQSEWEQHPKEPEEDERRALITAAGLALCPNDAGERPGQRQQRGDANEQ